MLLKHCLGGCVACLGNYLACAQCSLGKHRLASGGVIWQESIERCQWPEVVIVVTVLQLKQFAMTNSVHVWLVAHPKQLNAWKGAAPTLYDISGSAHFNNKADVGMVVHRDLLSGRDDKTESPKVQTGHPLENDPFACQVIIRKV